MTHDFLTGVRSMIEPILGELGFRVDGYVDDLDEGGLRAVVVFYRSHDCKLQIYKSSREGNINCMIAPASAMNEFGPHDRSGKWQYVKSFSPAPNVSLEELVKSVRYKSKTEIEQLEEVRDRILECYDERTTESWNIFKTSSRFRVGYGVE